MLHSISSSHFPTHRNCKRNACRLSLIACNLSHKNCTHKCVCQCVCVLLKIIYCRIMHIFITLELHKFRHYCTLRPAAAPSSSSSLSFSSSLLLLCLAAHRQVIVASSRWLQQSHTQTHTDRQADRKTDRQTDTQADRLCICICGSSAEGLDFCMPWLSQRLTEKVLLPGQGRSCT